MMPMQMRVYEGQINRLRLFRFSCILPLDYEAVFSRVLSCPYCFSQLVC